MSGQGEGGKALSIGAKAASAAVGALFGGLIQAITGEAWAGSAAGNALTTILDDASARLLSRREQERIGTALGFAIERMTELTADPWSELRTDDFFTVDYDSPGFFREIVEGVVVSAQREHEERKLKHLGYLIANLAFEPDVDRTSANWALRTASEMSWTQYVLLALLIEAEENPLPHFPNDNGERWLHMGPRPDSPDTWSGWSTWQEFEDLGPSGLKLLKRTGPAMILRPGKTLAQDAVWPDRGARSPRATFGARLLHRLLFLDQVPESELDRISGQLQCDYSGDGPPLRSRDADGG